MRSERAVGFDLDLTLIDTRAATALAAEAAGQAVGVQIDGAEFASRIGPPLRDEFARLVPDDQVEAAIAHFRQAFVADGLGRLRTLAGAAEVFGAVRSLGLAVVVITSRIPSIASVCLDACGLQPDAVVGDVSGREKAIPLQTSGSIAYVGDHPLDMEGARVAGVTAVGITTGSHGSDELSSAGAQRVVSSLADLVSWKLEDWASASS